MRRGRYGFELRREDAQLHDPFVVIRPGAEILSRDRVGVSGVSASCISSHFVIGGRSELGNLRVAGDKGPAQFFRTGLVLTA